MIAKERALNIIQKALGDPFIKEDRKRELFNLYKEIEDAKTIDASIDHRVNEVLKEQEEQA